ncbi:serine/threonine protein kinase [Streptomyces sp. A3M-1-3]|uniref:serine/threonine-protein kinase n=1 Tax=Streptomyces sp. A3M-1-3 TaxID=2962044 RepID=UPI0020B80F9A|nr:serine/threonine-protein kinase [Streptomyces sp. A3M-1-3]MCP3821360.1 serine/threonine protein kinase [Streptomyces sp. A3M-1-3]
MGTVYAALTDGGDRVAVKLIHPLQAGDPEFRARFRREVRLSAQVQGPFLLPLLAADPDADAPWLATAYAPGPTLAQHLAAHGPLTDGTLYAFATGTAQALAAIHSAGVVHRDVKPQNVLLTQAGPRVLDFGIAHAADGTSVTRTGVLTGTPGWISPEHYRSGVTAAEGDLFAWGALVAYATTGRLPFGTGTLEAVAYRVTSGRPDLDGIPEALKDVLEQALAKEPAERPAAAEAAEACARLLAAESTQLLNGHAVAEAGNNPILVRELATAQWSIPAPDDPSWPLPASAPPGRSSRRQAVVAVLVAAAVVGASAGGVLAFRHDGSDTDTTSGSETAASAASTGVHDSGTASSRTPSAVPGTEPTGQAATDPRTVPVPADPLADVADPAFTRADDETQPVPGEWRASRDADGTAEQEVAAAIVDQVTAMLTTKDMSFMTPTVTFNRQAQTVMVTGGPISTLTDDYKEVFRRAGEMAACVTLAHRLKDAPTSWQYGRFSVYWKDYDGQDEATILGFGSATDGCYAGEAGRRQGTDEGIVTAGLPSGDKNEIRVAGDTVKAITTAWNTRVAEGYGLEPFDRDDAITLGFDPVERMMYVWAWDGSGALSGRAQQSHFQEVVAKTACPKLLAEYNTNKHWNYTHWTIAAYQGNSAWPQLFASGDCLPTDGRP